MANRYPAYLEMLQNVQQNQHIQINVIQNVQKVENGQVTGVIINVNASSPESVFNRVVRDPLEALLDKMVNQQIVILVDALDEALSYSGDVKIISLLSNNSNLPSKVRFILTCRQDTRVENEFPDRESLVLSGFKYNQRNQRDICLYIQHRLSKDKELVAKAVQIDSAYVSKLIEVVPHKADGNFLYVRFLLDAMAKGHRSLTDLEGLPEELDELYFDSLKRAIKLGKRDWASEYAPLLVV